MRWSVFAIATYFVAVLQVGLAKPMAMSTASGSVRPEFVLILAVFVALSAPTKTVVVACAVLGLIMDLLSSPLLLAGDEGGSGLAAVTIIGPYTLGYMAGGYLVVQLRPMLFRQHPMTLAAMTLVAGAEAHLIVLGLWWVRQWYDPILGFTASAQLIPRALGMLYTAALALLAAFPLVASTPIFGFHGIRGQGLVNPNRT